MDSTDDLGVAESGVAEWIVEIGYTHVLEDYVTVVTTAKTKALAIQEAERQVYAERSSEDSPAAEMTIIRRWAEPYRVRRGLTLS